jgi:hypothetical protein
MKKRDRFEKFRDRIRKNNDKKDLHFFRNRLCSLKQFVGEGELYIDVESNIFSSKSVEVLIQRKDGNTVRLSCDFYISNGIKIGEIDEDFLLAEELNTISPISNKLTYKTNCCVFYENGELIITSDRGYYGLDELSKWQWDFHPIEEYDDNRFTNKNFKMLCRVIDYIGDEGSFYQNKNDKREFVITRFDGDTSAVRILCSHELEFQLLNGKKPEDLLENYISIFVNQNGEEFLRIFDTTNIKPEPWHKSTAILLIIRQVMKNPYQYSFVDILFKNENYHKIK